MYILVLYVNLRMYMYVHKKKSLQTKQTKSDPYTPSLPLLLPPLACQSFWSAEKAAQKKKNTHYLCTCTLYIITEDDVDGFCVCICICTIDDV